MNNLQCRKTQPANQTKRGLFNYNTLKIHIKSMCIEEMGLRAHRERERERESDVYVFVSAYMFICIYI